MVKKIGILTGGGDCGGLNAVIEAVTRFAVHEGWEVDGIVRGWEGAIIDNRRPLRISDVQGIHSETGTFLQTSRTNPYKFTGELDGVNYTKADVSSKVIENARRAGLEAIIACGGDDTLSVVPKLVRSYGEDIIFIGVPKTMDGDLQVYSLGLDTAINRAREVIEDFIPILKANGSIGFVELFGRDVGRVAFKAGISAGADVILIPEIPINLEHTSDFIANRYDERAKNHHGVAYVTVVVAEGTPNPATGEKVYLSTGEDSFGHGKLGGIGDVLAKSVYDRLKDDPRIRRHIKGLDIKTQRPTYDIRGGETRYSDSYIGQKLGAAAVKALKNGVQTGMAIVDFNENGQVEIMPVEELVKPRLVHARVVDLFERSGAYCFGRRPNQELYSPITFVEIGPK